MAEGQWYYTRGGQQSGPVSFQQLQQLAGSGQIAAGDLVWQEGMANWSAASTIPGLMAGGGGAAAAAATPAAYPQQPQYAPPAGAAYGGPTMGYATPGMAAGGQSFEKDARTAMILGIVGIFCCGIILGPIALIQGMKAKKNMQASGNLTGQGMATAGIICGIVAIVLSIIGIIVNVAMRMNS
jgi:hypothetical protein